MKNIEQFNCPKEPGWYEFNGSINLKTGKGLVMLQIDWNCLNWYDLYPQVEWWNGSDQRRKIKSSIQNCHQKWLDAFSTPIDRDSAATTVSLVYLRAGYAPPQIVFVDSFLAAEIAPSAVAHLFSYSASSVQEDLLKLINRLEYQLFQQLVNQFEDERQVLPFMNRFTNQRDNGLKVELMNKYGNPDPIVDERLIPYSRWELSDNEWEAVLDQAYPIAQLSSRLHTLHSQLQQTLQNTKPFDPHQFQPLDRLGRQLFEQFEIDLNQCLQYPSFLYFPRSAFLFGQIANAAAYDFAHSIGMKFEAEDFQLFQAIALNLGVVSMFQEICFISDRPQFKRDARGNLHALGEPAIQFPDGFGGYFHHGVQLPDYCGRLHPHHWQPQWILKETNSEIRRILIQEIGYARICEELQAEVLDTWREYTLLKLPIYDGFGWEATYLLKMICPSTGSIYTLRVPPDKKSAREAATWVNWDVDPESFAAET